MWEYLIVALLLLLSATFSGLTLGLMGLDKYELKRKIKLGDKNAIKIYPVRRDGNFLLCVLLLGNVAVNSVMSIFLGSIANGLVAAIIATGLIVIFGEIIPQALFSRYALIVGAKTVWLVRFFSVIMYPVAKPLSLILDKSLGGELPSTYSRKELQLLVDEQEKLKDSDVGKDEAEIIEGGLEYSHKQVKDVMTPKVNVFSLRASQRLDLMNVKDILRKGHSRIPVYNDSGELIVGILYAKDLITLDPEDRLEVKDMMRDSVMTVNENESLGSVLRSFKKKRRHIFVVINDAQDVSGVITLEDVLEEIVGEIVDEYDRIVDMRKLCK